MPESQKYMKTIPTAIMAVTAMESATPSPSRSEFSCSDIFYSGPVVFKDRHYSSSKRIPKRESRLATMPVSDQNRSSNLMKILTNVARLFLVR